MKGYDTTTLVIVLLCAVLGGVLLGSATPFRSDRSEGFKESRDIEKKVEADEKHIEDMRKVLRDTVSKLKKLESRNNNNGGDSKSSVDKRQSRHIEELREVLSNTIRQLRKDDILPGGTACGCASKPLVDPATGMAEETEGCRPPGWMRMMEREHRRRQHQDDCPLRHYDSPSA